MLCLKMEGGCHRLYNFVLHFSWPWMSFGCSCSRVDVTRTDVNTLDDDHHLTQHTVCPQSTFEVFVDSQPTNRGTSRKKEPFGYWPERQPGISLLSLSSLSLDTHMHTSRTEVSCCRLIMCMGQRISQICMLSKNNANQRDAGKEIPDTGQTRKHEFGAVDVSSDKVCADYLT